MVQEAIMSFWGDETEAYGADPSNPKRYKFRYKVMDIANVKASHLDNLEPNPDYPKELQPRIRDRTASRVQINTMAEHLNPTMLLHDSGFLDTGPIIVGSDNVVESGNGRTLALRYAAQQYPDKYQYYVEMLKENANQYGLGRSEIAQMKQPILVRERLEDTDRVKFAAEANVGAVMRMSPYEQALQDSSRLSDNAISTLEIGEDQSIDQALRSKSNLGIVQNFVSTLPANERAAVSQADGNINQQGLERLKIAIFAKTYPGESGQRLVRIFGENVDPVVKSLENSMFQSLPDMAKAESLIGSGQRDKSLSAADDLAEVVDTFAMLKQRNMKVTDYLAQQEMFEEKLTPNQKILLEHLDNISKKPKLVREFLRETANKIVEAPPPGQVSMMGFETPKKEDLINATIEKQRKEAGLAPISTLSPSSEELEEPQPSRVESPDQTGLAGMGKEEAQVEMLGEFGAYASEEKQPLVDVTLVAKNESGGLGKLDYAQSGDTILIQNIEVPEVNRRHGVAKSLVEKLQTDNPKAEIKWGMLTEAGAKLKQSFSTSRSKSAKKEPRKVKIKPESEEDAMAAFNLWEEEEPEPEKPKPEPVKVEAPPEPEREPVGVRREVETPARAEEMGTEEIRRGTSPITMGDLKKAKWVGGKLVLEEEKPEAVPTARAAAPKQSQPIVVKQEKPKKKVKISQQKGAAGQLHRTLFHPPAAAHRPKMRVWENIFFNPIPKSRRRHPRKRVLKSEW